MKKGLVIACIKNNSQNRSIEAIREDLKINSDHKVNIVVSGNMDMKDNIIQFAKARIET